MGGKGLPKFLKDKGCRDEKIEIKQLEGTYVAGDVSFLIYKHLSVAIESVTNQTNLAQAEPDRKLIINKVIAAILSEVMYFLGFNIVLILVFDGPVRKEKLVMVERSANKKKAKEKIAEAKNKNSVDLNELATAYRRYVHPNYEEVKYIKQCLSSLGVPCLSARHDGEELCTQLVIQGICSAVYANDSDCLIWGAPLMINGKAGTQFDCIKLSTVLSVLNVTHDQFKMACIGGGCDYNENIYQFGIGKSYKYIKNGGTLEELKGNECLNLEFCYKLFSTKHWTTICTDEQPQLHVDHVKLVKEGYLGMLSILGEVIISRLYELMVNVKCEFMRAQRLPQVAQVYIG